MNAASKRLPEFEVVRTVSILLLLIHHSGFYSLDVFGVPLQGLPPYFEAFLLGCFFFISGYFMEMSLQRSGGNLTAFLMTRWIKIYPPYLLAFALYIFVLGNTFKERFDLIVYLAGAQFIFAGIIKPILTLWYVGAILLFYVIFLLPWKIAPKTISLILISVVAFVLAYILHQTTGLLDVRFFKYYFAFLTGMLLARQSESESILSSRWIFGKSAVAVLGIWFFSLALNKEADPISLLYISASYLFIVSTAILLFTLVAKLSIVSPWRWVISISYASYFVYLFHRPFWKLLEDAIPVQGLQNQILFRMLPASAIILVVCYFLQRFYDFLSGALKRQSQRLKLMV